MAEFTPDLEGTGFDEGKGNFLDVNQKINFFLTCQFFKKEKALHLILGHAYEVRIELHYVQLYRSIVCQKADCVCINNKELEGRGKGGVGGGEKKEEEEMEEVVVDRAKLPEADEFLQFESENVASSGTSIVAYIINIYRDIPFAGEGFRNPWNPPPTPSPWILP
ncbi:hypothetical protein PoB_005145700 [Plakobranchus ocellatus]|uniref:Uncharacterized protein n=1 Tax=Plakobranchus ocellatus TaxID=259542 RepID=A0AAV4C0S1_9GAST|nr:hypothetical protein PoB_005145700 [Plakobranchus ocellatus]